MQESHLTIADGDGSHRGGCHPASVLPPELAGRICSMQGRSVSQVPSPEACGVGKRLKSSAMSLTMVSSPGERVNAPTAL